MVALVCRERLVSSMDCSRSPISSAELRPALPPREPRLGPARADRSRGHPRLDDLWRLARLPRVRLRLHHVERLERQRGSVRRLGRHRRHADLGPDRPRHRRSALPRHRDLPDAALPALAQAAGRDDHRAARRGSEHHLRHVGPLRLRAALRAITCRSRSRTSSRACRSSAPSSMPACPPASAS